MIIIYIDGDPIDRDRFEAAMHKSAQRKETSQEKENRLILAAGSEGLARNKGSHAYSCLYVVSGILALCNCREEI